MGCSDSKIQNPPQDKANNELETKDKVVKFAQASPKRSLKEEIDDKNEGKQKKSPQKITKEDNKTTQIKYKEKTGKQNVTKIKKAKELQIKPEHQKFISDIVAKSREKLVAAIPQYQVSAEGFSKPVVEYSPQKKGDIISKEYEKNYNKSQWARYITQNSQQIPNNVSLNQSFIAVNQTMKSPYKQKQIERKLNELRNESKSLGKVKDKQQVYFQLFDSNKTLYI